MNRLIKMVVCGTALAAGLAQAQTVEEGFIKAFAQCDDSLLTFIAQNKQALQAYAPVKTTGKWGQFVMQADKEGGHTIAFKKPMVINGVAFTGFKSQYLELPLGKGPDGLIKAYYWFLISPSRHAADFAKHFPQLGLQADGRGSWISNPLIILDSKKSLQWQSNDSALGGKAPSKGTVERSLYVEPVDGKPQLGCTVQGYIPQELVTQMRLDLLVVAP